LSEPAFAAVDWGTSTFRLWLMTPDGTVLEERRSDEGMMTAARTGFAEVLNAHLDATGAAPDLPVVVCGMAGSRQGWIEARYIDVPAHLDEIVGSAVRVPDIGRRVFILPGLAQRAHERADVMRGEETQLLGLLHLKPGFSGTAILPGTHSKWAEIRDGKLLRFSSAMTGEFYEVLSQHSVLRHSFAGDTTGPATEDGIAEGLEAGLANPDLLTALAFRTRAAALLSGKGPDWCSGYLSGLLVGTEIGGHRDWLAPGQSVPLIGSARFARLYGAALRQIGIDSFALDAADATIAGLKEARAQ
jgi:2-dehydro-3-deoxygalactonokinase